MKNISFRYGKTQIEHSFTDGELVAVLTSSIERYTPEADGAELIRRALASPIGTVPLFEMARGKKKIVLIASDHTRPVPSKLIVPAMLAEIRKGNPDADVTILIATGCHRGTTEAELIAKFGEEIVKNEKIVVHDCDDKEMLTNLGTLPSGGACEINKLAAEADLLVAEGFIEPHFFAGFSGGRKSVLPGIAGRTTVLANHCSEFIAHPKARTGILDGNPIHADMLWAAKQAKLAYIVNVVINEKKEAIKKAIHLCTEVIDTCGDNKQVDSALNMLTRIYNETGNYEKAEEAIWECRNCGHLVMGKKAPEACPVCAHPKSFFEIRKENY